MTTETAFLIPEGYAEHQAPADLAPFVSCFWTRRGGGASGEVPPLEYRVLPDGSSDIVFEFGGDNGDGYDGAMVVGTMTRPLVFASVSPRFFAGVRFRPGYAFTAFGIPADDVTDQNVPLPEFDQRGANDMARVMAQPTFESRVAAMVGLVRRRLTGSTPPPSMVRAAIRRIAFSAGNVRIGSLAGEIGVSRQHLARQFSAHAGVTPKIFARVARVRAAMARAEHGRDDTRSPDWSRIAYDLGYYDQPHFIEDFKSIVGLTPGEWDTSSRP